MEGISLGSAFLRLYGDRSALDRELETLKRYTDGLERKGISVKFDADTGKARREIDGLTNQLDGLNSILRTVGQGLQGDRSAWAGLSQTLGGLGGAAGGSAGGLGQLSGALGGAVGMAGKALPVLGQLGLAAQGLQAIFYGVSAAVNSVLGPLQALAAESGRFNQQVAEAGIFASQSFAILGPDGKAIEGTAAQMRAVRGVITKEYKEIQKEVAKISGATSAEIYEGFNLILQNSQSLGTKGEDLAFMRKLSTRMAAGMNVLGIPGQQLRSEVQSLLTGDIQMYDQLPKKLGYDRQTVLQLQAEGRFADDLMQRLNKLYEGQEVLSDSLANVRSNFEDIFQTINTEGAQALERGLAGGLKALQQPLNALQGTFKGALRGVSEALEPILRFLGEIGGWLVSAGSLIGSVVQVVGDLAGLVLNLFGVVMLPGARALGGLLQIVAKTFELIAAGASSLLRPMSAFLRVITGEGVKGVDDLFDGLFEGFDKAITGAEELAAKIALPFLEAAKGVAWLRGKLSGMSDKDIKARQDAIAADFATSLGGGAEPDLRSLKLSQETVRGLEERQARLGTGSQRRVNEAKELSQLVQDRVKNEIQGLEQALKLMGAQKGLQEQLNQLAESRRGLQSSRAAFAVQLASSPEARLAAEESRNDLAQRQEQERIQERRALLGTEREILQTQLQIQLRQQRLQEEQLRIQRLEIQIQRDKAQGWVTDIRQRMMLLRSNTPEYQSLAREYGQAGQELKYRREQLAIIDRTAGLQREMVGIVQQTNAAEARGLDLQEQRLGVQQEMAGLTRQQQALMAELQRREQAITNQRDAEAKAWQTLIDAREDQVRQLQQEERAQQRLAKLAETRLELQKAQAAAAVQGAEAELKVAQAQQQATENPGSVRAVIGAQIEALAAGAQGFVSEAEATQRLYDAKQRQLDLEQQMQRQQLEVQQLRERSEERIYELNLQRQLFDQKAIESRLRAEKELMGLRGERDALSAAAAASVGGNGAPAAPILPAPMGAAAIPAGARTGRTRDPDAEATGWDIVMPGGRGAAVRAPIALTITGTGFQGSGAGASGRGYGNWISGEFELGGKRYELLLGHFDRVDVAKGMQVPMGGQLGTQGITGRTFGTHVTSHVNPLGGASVADAWGALETLTRVWERGAAAGPAMAAAGGMPAPVAAITSSQNAIEQNTDAIDRSVQMQQELIDAWRMQRDQLRPALDQLQANTRQGLTATQQAQQDALRLERNRAQLTAEVLGTPRGRLAAQLTEAVAPTIGSSVRGVLQQLFQGEGFDLAGLAEGISRSMAERFTGALVNAALAPIEQALTQSLFRQFSGVDVQEQARQLAQQQAADGQQRAADTMQRAADTMLQAAQGGAALPSSGNAPATTGAYTLEPLSSALVASGAGLTSSMDAASGAIDVVATTAGQAAGGFQGLMQSFGKVAAVLGGVAMGVGGAQQMGKGGTYNTLMGLAGIFGSIGSIAGLFGGPRAAGGGGGLGFNPSVYTMPMLTGVPGRAFGGPVASNRPYVVGEQGMELFIPSTSGTVIPNDQTQALLATRNALRGGAMTQMGSGGAFEASREVLERNDAMARERTIERERATSLMAPMKPLDIRFESRVINGVEYVTAEEFQKGMTQAAERGRALTLGALKNSPKTRRGIGL